MLCSHLGPLSVVFACRVCVGVVQWCGSRLRDLFLARFRLVLGGAGEGGGGGGDFRYLTHEETVTAWPLAALAPPRACVVCSVCGSCCSACVALF